MGRKDEYGDRKGTRGGSGNAQRAAREVMVALRCTKTTVAKASIASVKKFRDRAVKSRTSRLRELVSEDACAVEVAVRMECHAWAKGGTISKMLKAVSAARLHEAIVGAHARRTGKKKKGRGHLSLEPYAALVEQGFIEADAKRKTLKEHLEATPEKDDERAAVRERAEATKKRGGKPLTPQSAKHRDEVLAERLATKLREADKKRKLEQIKRREEGKPFSRNKLKCYRKAEVNEVTSKKQVPGRTRYYAKVYLRKKNGSMKKDKKTGRPKLRFLTNKAPVSPANPDGGGETGYFPSKEAAYAAVKVHEDAEDADIAAHLAKKAAKK